MTLTVKNFQKDLNFKGGAYRIAVIAMMNDAYSFYNMEADDRFFKDVEKCYWYIFDNSYDLGSAENLIYSTSFYDLYQLANKKLYKGGE